MAKEEESPFTVRYPRNPDLDPQLVWRGKDQQDSQPLEASAVPPSFPDVSREFF